MFLAGRVPSGDRIGVAGAGKRAAEWIWACRECLAAEDFLARESTRTGVVIEEDGLESDRAS